MLKRSWGPGFVVVIVGSAAIGLALWLAPRKAADPMLGTQLLNYPDYTAADRLVIKKGAKLATLTKRADGRWEVPSLKNFPAWETKVRHVLDPLINQKLYQALFLDPADLPSMGFSEPLVMELYSGPNRLRHLEFGNERKPSGMYALVGEPARLFLIERKMDPPLTDEEWINHTLIDVPAEDIAEITVQFPSSPKRPALHLRRVTAGKEGTFALEGVASETPLEANHLRNYIEAARNISLFRHHEPSRWASVVAGPPKLLLKIKDSQGEKISVALFAKPLSKGEEPRALAKLERDRRELASHFEQWVFELHPGVIEALDRFPNEFVKPELVEKRRKR